MKILVIGGSGLIGSKLVNLLRTRGHGVIAARIGSMRFGDWLRQSITGD